ncbi:DNA replication terminus site-binding protein [Reinekea marinisedimentorum]|uniref:DNA replication terminus site binding protein n=1 Tax=Reinekea marinisedimentorum TaxID=230495 RepID=A0A4R3I903_9GAMM|nr:DNA replication terminus site-binding protein [Reinekea marinisedimentorum]TCS42624.1 hypothetical protein BCF53_103291 [Reinekea marinisedimentorum]
MKAALDLFEQLTHQLINFSNDVKKNPHWLLDLPHVDKKNALPNALLDLWYQGDQDGRQTRIYPGLVAINETQSQLLKSVNELKQEFRELVAQIKADDTAEWKEIQSKLGRRNAVLNEQLTDQGLNRVHLKQVFRLLPYIAEQPVKAGFNWYTSGRSITRISKQQAYKLLAELNTEADHIKIQLNRLAAISDAEPLARVQKQAPVLRTNLLFANGTRKAMNVSLPLFFKQSHADVFPEFNVPPALPPKSRSRQLRSDNKIEDEPFLRSIRVHRYS